MIAVFSLVVGILAHRPVAEYDTYFGIKIGQRIAQTRQISNEEVFSWSAQGRRGNSYEWLAHLWVYILTRVGGIPAIQWYVAISLILLFVILIHSFSFVSTQSLGLRTLFALVGVSLMYEFVVSRPQIISFLLLPLYIATSFVPSAKRLILLLPLTYVWANTHASFIFVPALFLSYGACYWILKKKNKSNLLAIYAIVHTIITLLPPVAPQPYLLLWEFAKDIRFLSSFISEWAPLTTTPYLLILYWLLTGIVVVLIIMALKKKKKGILLTVPLLIVTSMGAAAVRNIPYATIASLFLIARLFPITAIKRHAGAILAIICTVFLAFACMLVKRNESLQQAQQIPEQAVTFLENHRVSGRMFNQLALGGYLIYKLYPTYQVFFDGRAEVYREHEMRDFYPILAHKTAPREVFEQTVKDFLNLYQFSFIILPINAHDPAKSTAHERFADVLLDMSDWTLVYLDDRAEIFVKKDGKNDAVIAEFGLPTITPYRFLPVRNNRWSEGAKEYERLMNLSESRVARYGLEESLRRMTH